MSEHRSADLKRLLKIGFDKAGHWTLTEDGLELVLENFSDKRNVLYAFAVDRAVKYIGKTTMPLGRRMYGYLQPGPGQSTNIKNNENIRNALAASSDVSVYVLVDSGLHKIGDFHLNLAAGLEDSLISTLRPEWNGGRSMTEGGQLKKPADKQKVIKKKESRSVKEGRPEETAAPEHTFHLMPTYMRQGFFNVPVAAEKYYGKDKEGIEVLCGRSKQRIPAKINRSVNVNNVPRIMGGVPLRDWFTTHFKENELAQVTVLSPKQIHITRLK